MTDAIQKAAQWWNDPLRHISGTQWVEVPHVTENNNRRATGDPAMDWLEHSAGFFCSQSKPVKALSVGCGSGIIERTLRRRDICQLIHGLDLAESEIECAIQQAEAEGLEGLTYQVADLNTVTLAPETYDVVYAHASLHHVFQLEHLLGQIQVTLRPGGFFVIYEYVGPSQMQFPLHDLYLADVFLKSIPERYRRTVRYAAATKDEAPRFSLEAMNSSDPSEAIRAREIVPLVTSRFQIKHCRYIGGTLLFLIFNEIAGNFKADDATIMPFVDALIALDNFLVDNSVLPSYHVYMVTQKTPELLLAQTNSFTPLESPFLSPSIPAVTSGPVASITANPNPLVVDLQGLGQTTLTWTSRAVSRVEVHLNAPDGALFAVTGPGTFSIPTEQWARPGMTFYLQNVSNGLPLIESNTLAQVTLAAAPV